MFDLARFGRLVAATWLENRRPWGWFFAIGIIVHVLLCLAIAALDEGHNAFGFDGQEVIFFTGLFLTAPIFAGRYFQAMARRESALVLLMRPASAFEKWLLAAIVVGLLYPLAYVVAFQAAGLPSWLYGKVLAAAAHADAVARQADPAVAAQLAKEHAEKWRYFLPWKAPDTEWRSLLPMLFSLQGFALLGSLYFKSMPIIKTVVTGFFVLLLLIFASAVAGGDPGLFFNYWAGRARLLPWQQVVLPLAWFGVPALLWIGSLFALREREVA